MKPIIDIQGIWKQYQIGGQKGRYLSIRESISQMGRQLFGGKKASFWALSDISFPVNKGECVGIIGKNGAGKSTLLKILSSITPPTKGKITMRGRVASLLEVGTGFHNELTGRENIFLNGSILGMKRTEIIHQLDEIVEFSGVSQFLDTPLKHYSSGMQLRLAFSVAAHLNPEILLIDEVLAVGDAEFQRKCLGKMDEVSKSGRTIIFISHDLGAVSQLCSRGIWLNEGQMQFDGPVDDCLQNYEHWITQHGNKHIAPQQEDLSTHSILSVQLSQSSYDMDSVIDFSMKISLAERVQHLVFGLMIRDVRGKVVGSQVIHTGRTEQKGEHDYQVRIPKHSLAPDHYTLSVSIAESSPHNVLDSVVNLITFEITSIQKGNNFSWDRSFGPIVFHQADIQKI